MNQDRKSSRRTFHESAIKTGLGVSLLTAGSTLSSRASATPRESASEADQTDGPIRLGVIGLGSRGFNLLDDFLRLPDCRISVVCDVDDLHYRDRKWGTGKPFGRTPGRDRVTAWYKSHQPQWLAVRTESDYRRVVAADDVDAVVVATPDHWHAACVLAALNAGKDVYCEKPVTHLFAEGQQVVAAVARQAAIFQTGSQQRSAREFQQLVMLARNGVLGKIQRMEVGLPAGYARPMGSTKIVAPRPSLDYDFWCGPAPVLPLMQARHHRWWRGHRAYGGGVLMDWIGHHNDIAHWAIGAERSGPVRVTAVDWTFPETDVYDSPHQYTIRSEFASGVRIEISSRHTGGLKVWGERGWVFANRGRIQASNTAWLAPDYVPGDWKIGTGESHAANFLSGIRTRKECIAPAEIAHRSITPGHLGYVSQAVGKTLEWDPQSETIINDADADALLKTIDYRQPWQTAIKDA